MCTNGYVECMPVKESKPHKPRTKREQMFLDMHYQLPPLTDTQQRWVKEKLFPKQALYWNNKKVHCMCCGHIYNTDIPPLSVSLNVGSKQVCPHCGNNIKLQYWKDNDTKCHGAYREGRMVSFISTHHEYVVVRTFDITKSVPINGGKPTINMLEVFENWIDAKGKETILSRKYYRSPFTFRWSHEDIWGIRKHNAQATGYFAYNDTFDCYGNTFYPYSKVTPILKRNGFRNNLTKLSHRINMVELMQSLLTTTFAEELLKTGQQNLLVHWLNTYYPVKSTYQNWIHAVRICNRNNYIIKDAQMWLDYLDLLNYFHKDTHNAHYVCPDDLKAAHDRLYKKKEHQLLMKELAEKIKQSAKWESQYKKARKKFFGISFGNESIHITVLSSVKEFAEEGTKMHHCVFSNEYFNMRTHPNSLILSAKDSKGNRLETIEINIESWRLVQSRGVGNIPSSSHNAIIELINNNMHLLRQAS